MKEPFCGLSHLIGAVLSIAGLVVLLALTQGRPWQTISCAIYGVSMIALYTASALYHSLPVPPYSADRLQKLDHIAIYLLIAGTYTPLCLVTLRGPWGWSLFGAEYGLAVIGVLASLFWKRAPDWFRVVLYLIMGWLIVLAFPLLARLLPAAAIGWMVAGGIVYSIGTVIFATDWPHLCPGKFHAHDLWHLFVLGGSACHFVLILRFIAAA